MKTVKTFEEFNFFEKSKPTKSRFGLMLKDDDIENEEESKCIELGSREEFWKKRLSDFYFTPEESKQISLYLGDHRYLRGGRNSFDMKINKNIGLGISDETRRTMRFVCGKYKGVDGDHFILEYKFDGEERLFDCGNLSSVFNKIDELKNEVE